MASQTVIIAGNLFTLVTGFVLRRRGSRQTGGLRFVLLGVTGLIGMALFMIGGCPGRALGGTRHDRTGYEKSSKRRAIDG